MGIDKLLIKSNHKDILNLVTEDSGMSNELPTIVMVHGAWADGSSWTEVIKLLSAEGYRPVAAPLPLTSLADDVAALGRAIDRTTGPVILVAHAYAGAVIGELHDPRVRAYVYVAALAPDEGETVADVFYRSPPDPRAPSLAPDSRGLIYLPREAFQTSFAQNASPEESTVLFAVQRPISAACISVPVGRPAWKDTPSWFLVAQDDRMIVRDIQEFTAKRMQAHVHSHAVDHAPLITAPQLVADVIRTAALSVPAA
jgi:pimeloyl-ACP methyl ester carboxylesterase